MSLWDPTLSNVLAPGPGQGFAGSAGFTPRLRLIEALQPLPNSVEKGKLIAFVNRALKDLTDDDLFGLDLSELQSVVGFIHGHMDIAAAMSGPASGPGPARATSREEDSFPLAPPPPPRPPPATQPYGPPAGPVPASHARSAFECAPDCAALAAPESPLSGSLASTPFGELHAAGLRGLTRGPQISQITRMSTHTASTLPAYDQPPTSADLFAAVGSQGGSSSSRPGAGQDVTGSSITTMMTTDPFLVGVAPHYRWSMAPLTGFISIEEGVNAGRRAARVMIAAQGSGGGKWNLPTDAPGPPPMELTCNQVQEEIGLLANGLVEKGSHSMVFKCVWPKRFGQRSLLAAKVMRNLYCENLQQMISSFRYEADVLIQCRHRNVVRMYGYCLEPPTVCIITELLPHNLESRVTMTPRCILEAPPLDPAPSSSADLTATVLARRSQPGQATPLTSHSGQPGVGEQRPDASGEPWAAALGCVPPLLASILDAGPVRLCPGVPLTDVDILKLGADITAGLEHLHAEVRETTSGGAEEEGLASGSEDERPVLTRVVHRNLKPANILISSRGVAKISDFAPPRDARSSEQLATSSQYKAPELLEEVDEDDDTVATLADRADIYSLGTVLWELGTQQQPAVEANKEQAAQGSTGVQPETMLQRLPKFSSLVTACRQSQPARRPKANIVQAQLLKELDRLQAAAVASRPPTAP